MNLLRAEWSRLFARRLTRIVVLLVIGVLALVGVSIAATSQRPGPAATAEAKQIADQQRQSVVALRERCDRARADPSSADQEFKDLPEGVECAEIFDPARVRDEDFLPYAFDFREESDEVVLVFGGLFALLGFIVGASFVGAEWSSGGMMNLLTWRPRRLVVLGTKLVALLTGVTAIGVVLSAAWGSAMYAVSAVRGQPGPMTSSFLMSYGLANLRGVALALATAAAGFAIASLGRHTALALGLAAGYFLVLEIGMRIVLELTGVSRPERFLLSTYAVAWQNKSVQFTDFSSCQFSVQPNCEPAQWTVGMGQGALVLGIGTLVVLILALVAMRRRDVT